MSETLEIAVTIASLVLAVLAVGTALVWLAGRLGRRVERPARRLRRYLFPADTEDGDEDEEE